MIYKFAFYFYFSSLVFACICGIYRFKEIDTGSKVLFILVCCALVNESAAYFLAKKYQNNIPLYSVYCLIEFGILSFYFNKVIDVFIRWNLGIYIGISGIILGIYNLLFIQHLNTMNSYFLFFEGLSVIGLSLFAFFRLLLTHDSLHLYKYHHFWFICILVFFWSITFLNWGLYDYINLKLQHAAWKINFALTIIGAITYGSFGCVFLMYPKMQNHNE